MTARQTRAWAAAAVLAGALALSGCGSEPSAATSPSPTGTPAGTPTPEPAAALPAALRGSWKRLMRPRDWRLAGRGYPIGTWRFDVHRHGALDVYFPGKDTVDFTTQFVVKGQQLTVESIPVCPGQTERFRWRASHQAMTLTVVGKDPCKQGAALFGGTWTRRR